MSWKVQIAKVNGEKKAFLVDTKGGRSYNLLEKNEHIRKLTGHTGEAWCQNMLLEDNAQLVCEGVHRDFRFTNLDVFEKGKEKRNFDKRIRKVRRWVNYIKRQNFLIEFPVQVSND